MHATGDSINSIVRIGWFGYPREIHCMSFWSELPSHALYCGFLTAGRIGELLRSERVVVLSYMNCSCWRCCSGKVM